MRRALILDKSKPSLSATGPNLITGDNAGDDPDQTVDISLIPIFLDAWMSAVEGDVTALIKAPWPNVIFWEVAQLNFYADSFPGGSLTAAPARER